ncbi:Vinorine synthase [Morus notabilis]|uniref:Vinorine synthase n=1 Tax=Morus notabilis TaxID=981085 RepID=W9RMT2_9ROSA|nr:BAHD acyltransferase BIA1 [Morus notabilis]EXB82426.1 Vinorine synthase [Morus notabilis]
MDGIGKVDIIARNTIKPSSPTPDHLRIFKLSLLDQIIPPMYGLIVFFYPAETGTNFSEQSSRLRESLSRTLTTFYPMAGRTNAIEPSIDCSDDGAFFVEAKMDCELSDFLRKPDGELLNNFLPTTDPLTAQLSEGYVTLIQITGFRCGGTAVSVCISHKIGDISSLVTFLHGWTSSGEAGSPVFVGDSLLPPRDLSFAQRTDIKSGNLITKRFVFEASKISHLKDKVGAIDHNIQMINKYPSRVEVVMAQIFKCAIAASRSVTGSFKTSVLFHSVNLRPRTDPPLPENSVGNLIWFVPVVIEESEMDLRTMVHKMKRLVNEFCNEKAKKFKDHSLSVLGEFGKWAEFKEMEFYSCSSWCKFPLYETDFGWGKPIWVSSANLTFKNSIILVDTREGDGIEAWVTLEEEKMAIFERDNELLDSATFNPSAYLYITSTQSV